MTEFGKGTLVYNEIFNIYSKLIDFIKNLHDKASSATLRKVAIDELFPTKNGIRQGCLLSHTLFILFLEEIMDNALHSHNDTIKMNGRLITDLRFADDIDGIAGSEEELVSLKNKISLEASKFGMEINPTKTKLMLNDNACNPRINIHNEQI